MLEGWLVVRREFKNSPYCRGEFTNVKVFGRVFHEREGF